MQTISVALLTLFRPKAGVDRLGPALRWLWIPILIVLVASVAAKAVVSSPMAIEASQEVAAAQLEEAVKNAPEKDRPDLEKSQAEISDAVQQTSGIVSTAAMVFGVLGALGSVLYVAVFFFIAAKTWANPVPFASVMSVAALSAVPRAIGNAVQAVYMSATGVYLQHPGLGALVAPAKATDAPGVAYAVLSQIDIWLLWGLAILFGALVSKTVGVDRKRAGTAMLVFIVVTGAARAIPTIVAGAFMGSMG